MRSTIFIALFCIAFSSIFAQSTNKENQNELLYFEYKEQPSDEYRYIPRAGRQTSPAYQFSNQNFSIVQVNINENGENILGDAANEPSIAINPLDPDRLIIGWRQFDTIGNNFRQAGFSYTTDGGLNWISPGVIEPGIFRSDPVLDFDVNGKIYYNSLSVENGDYICDVFESTGDGTWDGGTFAQGGDKQWMVIDRTSGSGQGNIYAFWKQGLSYCPSKNFTRSVDEGLNYEECGTIPGDPIRGTLTVGPNGELYACGQQGNDFVVAKSSNAWNAAEETVWDFGTTVSLDGRLGHSDGPNPAGMLGQVWIATDHSGGETHGNVYMLCSVNRASNNDPLDVMFIRSIDGGQTWSDPIRINDDSNDTAFQWFGTMSVAPNGRIDVIWLDTRDFPGEVISTLYYSYSYDGGLTWSANEPLSDSFDPHLGFPQQNKIGDYFEMISDENGAHLAWAATFNGEQDVYYSYILNEVVATEEKDIVAKQSSLINFPNPFGSQTTISYTVPQADKVQLVIYNELGQVVRVFNQGQQPKGTFQVNWDGKNNRGIFSSSGIYFIELMLGGKATAINRMLLFLP